MPGIAFVEHVKVVHELIKKEVTFALMLPKSKNSPADPCFKVPKQIHCRILDVCAKVVVQAIR